MAITRTAPYGTLTDDSGAGTDGTIYNNAWLQGLLDLLDARWSRTTTTSTGTQTVINPSEADLLICNNATDLTIRSLTAPASPAKPGKRLYVVSTGAGNVFLNHQDTTGTTAANRMINFATSGTTPLAAGSGVAIYVYDDANSRWRLMLHEQGAWLTFVPTAGAATGTWTIDNPGDILTSQYWLKGRTLFIAVSYQTTTTSNATATLSLTIPGGFTSNKQMQHWFRIVETATAKIAIWYSSAASTSLTLQRDATDAGNVSALTNNLYVLGEIFLEVT